MPTVGVGETVYPVLTATLSVEALAENAAGTETTGSFSSPSHQFPPCFPARRRRFRLTPTFRNMATTAEALQPLYGA